MTTLPIEPYRARRIQPLGVVERAGWTIKLIGITAGDDLPGDAEVTAALEVTERELPRQPGVGFTVVHRGADALWVLVCWWELELMYERLWRADLGSTDLRPMPPDGPTACVWELQAICHERHAWTEHVLTSPSAPDFAGYLAATLTVAGPTP